MRNDFISLDAGCPRGAKQGISGAIGGLATNVRGLFGLGSKWLFLCNVAL